MAEAFVKTFKRDYVHAHDCPDAITVMIGLAAWFEDYNEQPPHKGLRMRSPREYIRELSVGDAPPPIARREWTENKFVGGGREKAATQ